MSMQNGGSTTMDAATKRATLRKGVDAAAYPLPFKHGGKIYIKPENRGKFNATKAATGKSTEELTHSSNPVTKKRAVFAQNAAKWKHADGGKLGTGSTFDKPAGKGFQPVTAFGIGGSIGGPGAGASKSPWQAVDDIPSSRPGFRSRIFKNTDATSEPDYTSPVTREEFMKNTGPFTKSSLDFPLNQARTAFETNPNMRSVTLGRERQPLPGESMGVNPPYPLSGRTEDYRDLNPVVSSPKPFSLPGVAPFSAPVPAPGEPAKMSAAVSQAMARKSVSRVDHKPEGYDYKRGLPAPGSITRRARGGTIDRSPSIMPSSPPDMNESLLRATRSKLSKGGSVQRPTPYEELNPASASSGLLNIPSDGIQAPILMYNTRTGGLNEAVAAALRRVTPLPQASKGMKLFRKKGNGSFGDKTASPAFGTKTGLTIKK